MQSLLLTKEKDVEHGINYNVYEGKDRDINKFIKKSISKNTDIIEKSYEGKISPLTLKGAQAKDYMGNIIRLFEKVRNDNLLSDIFLNEQIGMINKFLNNFKVFFRIKSNIKVKNLDGNKLDFDEILTLDINKRTGFPFYGEIEGMIDYIKSYGESDKVEVNKFFEEFIKNKNKLNKNDYLKLLALSNKMAMAEIDTEKLQYMEEIKTNVYEYTKHVVINNWKYNHNTGFELITADFSGSTGNDVIAEKGFINTIIYKKSPVSREYKNRKIQLYLDRPFEELLRNVIINDPYFLDRQIAELFLKEYGIEPIDKPNNHIEIISIGIKTPYNEFNKEFFPEFDLKYSEEDYFLIIRKQNSKNRDVMYATIK